VVLKFNAHLVKCRLKYGLCNPPLEIKQKQNTETYFSLISIFFNTRIYYMSMRLKNNPKTVLFQDVQTSEIKLQLNNAAGGRLKRTADRRQFCFISASRCATGFRRVIGLQ